MALDRLPDFWYIRFYDSLELAHAIEKCLYTKYDIEPPDSVSNRDYYKFYYGNVEYYTEETDLYEWEYIFVNWDNDIDLGAFGTTDLDKYGQDYEEITPDDIGIDISLYLPWWRQ